MRLTRIFTEHPATVGETYWQHLVHACGFAFWMLVGGIACFLHALLPFACVTTGSGIIRKLYDRMVVNRTGKPADTAATGAALPQ